MPRTSFSRRASIEYEACLPVRDHTTHSHNPARVITNASVLSSRHQAFVDKNKCFVTKEWLLACVRQQQLLPISASPLYQPLRDKSFSALASQVCSPSLPFSCSFSCEIVTLCWQMISICGYGESTEERDDLIDVLERLRINWTGFLCRENTHLIVDKYAMVPWESTHLFDCSNSCMRSGTPLLQSPRPRRLGALP